MSPVAMAGTFALFQMVFWLGWWCGRRESAAKVFEATDE